MIEAKKVIIESPFSGDVERNLEYLRACMRDCVLRHESPYASHGLLAQPGVLRDNEPTERALGITLGFEWHSVADYVVVYGDLGISDGMFQGIKNADAAGLDIKVRRLYGEWTSPHSRSERSLQSQILSQCRNQHQSELILG